MKESVSNAADGVNVLPKKRDRSAPYPEGRHEEFQLGTNPMRMTDFEKSLVVKEKMERRKAKDLYVLGIQGVDGGPRYRDHSDL